MNEEDYKTEDAFLELLAKDIEQYPDNLHTVTPAVRQRLADLVEGVEIDLDALLPTDEDAHARRIERSQV